MKRRIYLLGLTAALFFFHSCVTQKRKDDLSGIAKVYHNTTAKYNGYFNADEIMKTTLLSIEQQHRDNYQKRLDLFPYMAIKDPKMIGADMDIAIEKVTKVVALHPRSQWTDDCYLLVGQAQFMKQDYEAAEATFRFMVAEFDPEKPANAKSNIAVQQTQASSKARAAAAAAKAKEREELKKEREKTAKAKQKERKKAAQEAARKRKQYNKEAQRRKKKGLPPLKPAPSSKTAPNAPAAQDPKQLEEEAKKKAKEEAEKRKAEEKAQQPENYFLKHRPVYQEGLLWLARTLIERDNEETALRMLSKLQQDPKTFDAVRAQIWPVMARLFLKRGQEDEAVMPLEQAIATSDSRTEKARYAFILAQLHQEAGRWQQAGQAFDQVLSFADKFDMRFRASLDQALNSYRAGTASAAEARSQLERMLKEEKNTGYQDQIYFALANLALDGKDRQAAIENLQQSLQHSAGNAQQKAESYFTLAQLFLDEEQFVQAKNYLDSTLMTLPDKDERIREVTKLRDNLTDIATHLVTIQEQDSLLKLSLLSDKEKLELASKIRKEEDEKRLAALAAKQAPAPGLPTSARREIGAPPLGAQAAESTFFAYNDRNLKRGERDFEEKWGNRPLEDNWRRSNRRGDLSVAQENAGQNTAQSGGSLLLSPEEVDAIFKNVPKNDADRRLAEYKISESMYKLGVLYREKLGNARKSVDILEQLQTRFPRNNFELDSWFYLYMGYTDLGNAAKAKEYAGLLTDKYPSSKYARAILNPNYRDELVDKETQINKYYDQAYTAFQERRYQESRTMCLDSRARFGIDNPLLARFALLAALCTGSLEGKEAYQQALSEVIAKYPDTDEQKQAREILRILGGGAAALPGGQKQNVSQADGAGAFSPGDDQLHYILVVGEAQMNINDSKNAVSDYIRKYNKLDKLSITNMFIGQDEQTRVPVLIIRRFDNRAKAMKFYEEALSNQKEFYAAGKFELLAISLNNYRELVRQQSVDGYRQYFEQNYR